MSIKVGSNIKQQFTHLFARHLSHLGMPYNLSYIQEIVMTMLSNEEVLENVKKELTRLESEGLIANKQVVLNSYKTYKPLYFQTTMLLEALKKKKDVKGRDTNIAISFDRDIKKFIKESNSNLPIVSQHLMILFLLCVKGTDLERSVAPSEEILNPDKVSSYRRREQSNEWDDEE